MKNIAKNLYLAIFVAITSFTFTACNPFGDEPGNDDGNENINGSENNNDTENGNSITVANFVGTWEGSDELGNTLYLVLRYTPGYIGEMAFVENSEDHNLKVFHDINNFMYQYDDDLQCILMYRSVNGKPEVSDAYYVIDFSPNEMTICQGLNANDGYPITLRRCTGPTIAPHVTPEYELGTYHKEFWEGDISPHIYIPHEATSLKFEYRPRAIWHEKFMTEYDMVDIELSAYQDPNDKNQALNINVSRISNVYVGGNYYRGYVNISCPSNTHINAPRQFKVTFDYKFRNSSTIVASHSLYINQAAPTPTQPIWYKTTAEIKATSGDPNDAYINSINGKTYTIDYVHYPATDKYYVYGGEYSGNSSANEGKGELYEAHKGYNSILINHGESYYWHNGWESVPYTWDVYLCFTIP